MYEPGLTKKDLADMAAAGFTLDDYPEEVVEVWPENMNVYQLFAFMRTQWRIGMAGATGLDYGPLYRKMDRMDLSPQAYEHLEEDIQAMEFAALAAMTDRDE